MTKRVIVVLPFIHGHADSLDLGPEQVRHRRRAGPQRTLLGTQSTCKLCSVPASNQGQEPPPRRQAETSLHHGGRQTERLPKPPQRACAPLPPPDPSCEKFIRTSWSDRVVGTSWVAPHSGTSLVASWSNSVADGALLSVPKLRARRLCLWTVADCPSSLPAPCTTSSLHMTSRGCE